MRIAYQLINYVSQNKFYPNSYTNIIEPLEKIPNFVMIELVLILQMEEDEFKDLLTGLLSCTVPFKKIVLIPTSRY
jgi:hypothetical protein